MVVFVPGKKRFQASLENLGQNHARECFAVWRVQRNGLVTEPCLEKAARKDRRDWVLSPMPGCRAGPSQAGSPSRLPLCHYFQKGPKMLVRDLFSREAGSFRPAGHRRCSAVFSPTSLTFQVWLSCPPPTQQTSYLKAGRKHPSVTYVPPGATSP